MATQNFEKFSSLLFYGERSETGESTKHECQMDTPVKPEYDKRMECGRSMVEMLGTLAIIGVLSIGGIAGYSYGMDKYRANQTVNDVMLRAVDVMTQLSQGKEPNLEPEWGTKGTVYDMEAIQDTTNNTWGIVVDGVPSRVCQMVGDALKNQATVYVGNAERNDTTDNDPCESSDSNTMEFYFDTGAVESDGCKTDADCGADKYCDKDTGFCFNGSAPAKTYGACDTSDSCCSSGDPYTKHGDDCTINTPNDGMCYYGTCVAKGCTYDENKCTGFGVYCASPNDSCTEAFPNGKTGTCMKADFAKLDVDGKTYYVSHNHMSWWDADAACKALGRNGLVKVDDLINGWNGATDYDDHNFTALGQALQSHYGTTPDAIWTENLTDGVNSCGAYSMYLSSGGVMDYDRGSTYNYAVCR